MTGGIPQATSIPGIEHFWCNVVESGDCWLWTTRKDAGRYPSVRRYGKVTQAHIASFEHHFGPVPRGLVVMHSCDTTRCVRPDHLGIGRQVDNVADMRSKERGRGQKRNLAG